ncbi:hypothetical protein B0H14DRAFT_3718267 [Mycena olivaceomarginata]|nr:hypothetical protein B0H14DRAFT_3718267 [Mycena olivaceomarginata]
MSLNFTERLTPGPAPRARDTWYYTCDIDDDLRDLNLPEGVKAEIFAVAYEYIRCVIPHCTDWEQYLAFMRIIIISIVAEFKGTIVDVLASDNLLGYSVPDLLDTLFQGSPMRENMERELRTCILFMAEKSSSRELFRRYWTISFKSTWGYVNCLADSLRQWFCMRDCDGLARFTVMAALACNDILDVCFSEEQLEIFGEIGITMYDAVAFYKHCSEGEVCSTFAYAPDDMRVAAFQQCREVLWALDAAWAGRPGMLIVPTTEEVVSLTRANFKLWYRIDADKTKKVSEESFQRYKDVLARSEEVLFPGLAQTLETAGDGNCDTCIHRASYGAEDTHCFGGVKLCDDCRASWRHFLESFPDRAAKAFPELEDMTRDMNPSAMVLYQLP